MDVPKLLTDPGVIYAAPLGTTPPVNTVAGGVLTDTWASTPWIGLGATTEGSTFNDSTSIEPIRVAEFFNPIKYVTTEGATSFAFTLAEMTLHKWRMARNGGVAALVPSGAAGSELYHFTPVKPGNEVRIMIGWQSLDNTMRLILNQVIQGGEVSTSFQRAPSFASIPCTFNAEPPVEGETYDFWSTRG